MTHKSLERDFYGHIVSLFPKEENRTKYLSVLNIKDNMNSRLQEIFKEVLIKIFDHLEFKENYRPPCLNGLELDFYLPKYNIAFEVQGRQHFEWCPDLQPTLNDFLKQRSNDGIKNKLCRENDINLYYIFQSTDSVERAITKINFDYRLNLPKIQYLFTKWKEHINFLNRWQDNRPRFIIIRNGEKVTLQPQNKSSLEFARNNKIKVTDKLKKKRKKRKGQKFNEIIKEHRGKENQLLGFLRRKTNYGNCRYLNDL